MTTRARRTLVGAVALTFIALAAPTHAEMIKGVVQTIDGSKIVVDGQPYAIQGTTRFEGMPQNTAVARERIIPGTRVILETDPAGHVTVVHAMIPG